MTLEEMANCSADVLEKLSSEELEAACSPFYNVTRPELAPKPQRSVMSSKPQQSIMSSLSPMKQKAMQMLAAEGLDMSFLQKKKVK